MSRESSAEAPPAAEAPRRRRRGRKTGEVTFCTVDCKYECVREAAQAQGWRLVGDSERSTEEEIESCNVYWVDVASIGERMAKLRPWQRINHIPGMTNIARKARLAQNLEKMRREFPKVRVRACGAQRPAGAHLPRAGARTRALSRSFFRTTPSTRARGCFRWSSPTFARSSTGTGSRVASLSSSPTAGARAAASSSRSRSTACRRWSPWSRSSTSRSRCSSTGSSLTCGCTCS